MNGQIHEESVVYMDYHSVIKKNNEILPFSFKWMEQENTVLSKIS